LNEHLRRVHTAPAGEHAADETEDDSSEGRPWKRKRGNTGSGDSDVRVELSKLRVENDELRRNSELQSQQVALRKSFLQVSLSWYRVNLRISKMPSMVGWLAVLLKL
jgi:hypothetical protein